MLNEEFRKIHQFLTFTSNTPIQLAYADVMKNEDHYLQLSKFYQAKRDFFSKLMKASRFTPLPCAGTYFQMMGYERISDEPDVDSTHRLTTQYGVAAIPPSVFYSDRRDHKVVRFCFAKQDQTLIRAAEKLCRI